MKKKLLTILVIGLSFLVGVFYYQKFFQDFSPEAYRHLDIAQNFLAEKECAIHHLPLPGLKAYEKFNLLFKDDWPCLLKGPLLGLFLSLVSKASGLTLESSYLFFSLLLFVLLALLSFRFFQRFLPLYLSIFAVFLLILNFKLLSFLFAKPEFVINLLVFLSVFYLLQKKLSLKNLILTSVVLGLNFYNSHLSLLFFIFFFFYILSRGLETKKEKILWFLVIFILIISPLLYYRYQITHNPFYSLEVPLRLVSFTTIYPGSDVYHYLRDIVVWDFWRDNSKEVSLKFFHGLQQGLDGLTKVNGNYILFALGFCGFFYNFRKFRPKSYPKLGNLDRIKAFGGVSFLFYFLIIAFFTVEIEHLLIFIPFILVWGMGFMVSEISRRRFKFFFIPLFIIVLLFINVYPFIFKASHERLRDVFAVSVNKEEDIINLGSPKLAYKIQSKTFELPPMPRYIESIEQEYYLKVYSVYLGQEAIDNSRALRFGGWEQVMTDKNLPGFELSKEFSNGDLYFVRRD